MCTHCRRKENGTVKNLKISTLPTVLIIHLKRFCQTKLSNSKLVYPVQFPLVGLNIRRYLATQTSNDDSGILDDEQCQETNIDFLYDLFAVCNHRGSMSNGHYTAYCKNPITGKWSCYDDHLVSELDPSRVCTPDAYILFYCRRDTLSSQQQQQQQPAPIDPLHFEYPSHSSSVIIDENFIRPIRQKPMQHHYTLEQPIPLPRKILTPLSPSSSHDEFSPIPRARQTQYDVETAAPPSPPMRRLPTVPPVHYVYPISTVPMDRMIEPLNDFYSPQQRYYNSTDRLNPWNRYNSQRYSDDEQERNVIYSKSILR